MGFRDRALRAVEDQREREQRQKDAQLADRRRQLAGRLNDKQVRRALKNWSKATGITPENLRVDLDACPALRLRWSAEGSEFQADPVMGVVSGNRELVGLDVRMKDEDPKHRNQYGRDWHAANTLEQIGDIFSGKAAADLKAMDEMYRDHQ